MRNLFFVACLLFPLAACGKKDEAGGGASGDKAEQFIADYKALKDKLCACADKDCATKVKAEADAHERSAKDKGIPKPTEDQNKRFEAIEDEINACADKHGAGPGSTP